LRPFLAKTFRIWLQYLLIGLAALPASAFYLLVATQGTPESIAVTGSAVFAVALAFIVWRLSSPEKSERQIQKKVREKFFYALKIYIRIISNDAEARVIAR
jgi:hypothetical protein